MRSAERFPRTDAVVDEFSRRTYEDLADDALRIARLLQDSGLRPGDRIALYLDNTSSYAAAMFGTLIAGGVFVPVNPQTKLEKLAFILADSDASMLIAEGHATDVATGAVAASGRRIPTFTTDQLPQTLAATAPEPTQPAMEPRDLAALVYTSGTTGLPKGVMLSHEALVFVTSSIAEYLRLDEDDRILSVLPLAYTYGLSQLLLSMRLGATLLLERSFAFPGRTLERMHHEGATVFPAVPTVFAALLGMKHSRSYDSLRCVTAAAAPLPPSFHEGIHRLFPRARLYRMYGQTECVRVCYLEPELISAKPTSVGGAIPGTEAIVLDESGNEVSPGEVGVLHVRGPHLMSGYWRDPQLTSERLKTQPGSDPPMLSTNDHFTVDEDGLLYFVGRTDDIIKTRGEKVSTVEIENVLHTVPGIRQAAVVGVPDEVLGEVARAFVVLEEGADLTEAEILRFARSKLENFMLPRDVVFCRELPITESGKVRKRSLQEPASAETAESRSRAG